MGGNGGNAAAQANPTQGGTGGAGTATGGAANANGGGATSGPAAVANTATITQGMTFSFTLGDLSIDIDF
jgi:hypothetical protein